MNTSAAPTDPHRGEPLPIAELWRLAEQHGHDAQYKPLSRLLVSLRSAPDVWQTVSQLSGRQKGKNHIATAQRLAHLHGLGLAETRGSGQAWRLGHAAFPTP